ncbi:MAG TPA: chorismate synthase [Candidatus Marinimicrobia bacterium]|nr:chorismate synthase [Candidatus Neomarinimicrobiota bacterium]
MRIMSAGESHGKGLSVIIDGFPAGLPVDIAFINAELRRRQQGYGRGQRMQIEADKAEILSGVRDGQTLGTPIALWIQNRDYVNWQGRMNVAKLTVDEPVTAPRPGHADLAGVQKFGFRDVRNVLERASARETAARVAAGALLKLFLREFGIRLSSQTIAIADIEIDQKTRTADETEESPLRCADPQREKLMLERIDAAAQKGDTLGGVAEIRAGGICPGLGTYTQGDERLDAKIAAAMMSIPSVKGVIIGDRDIATRPGSAAQDEIYYSNTDGFYRKTNHAGGIEGGMSNGEDIVVYIQIKPLPSLRTPLQSADIRTGEAVAAQKERADVCVVPAAGVVGEAMLALTLADAIVQKFGGDAIEDIKTNFQQYRKRICKI